MSCNWPLVKVDDLKAKTKGSIAIGPFGSRMKSDCYVEKGVPIIRGTNITEGPDFKGEFVFITEEKADELGSCNVYQNDLVFPHRGSIGEVGIILDDQRYVLSSSLMKISCDTQKVNPQFLYYFFKSRLGRYELLKNASQVGTPGIGQPLTSLKGIELRLPPLSIQDQITGTLSSINQKIAKNASTNQTLEQMAQAIFKSWFVDFDPVKAKMNGEQPEGMDAATASLFPEKLDSDTGLPEGWKLSEIGDEVAVVGGGTPSKKNDDFWVNGHIHWTSPKDLSGVQDKVLLDTASKLTETGLKKVSSGLLPVDTVLLSSRAPVGYLALAKVPLAVNQGYIAMKCEKVLPPEFVLQWCVHRMDEIKQRASGSTFAEISKKNFKPISVVVPSEEVLTAYQKLVKPLYDAITSNIRQSEQLSTLRDTLLPKLLSGQLDLERN
ncbi:MAG: restriction endonuclease subunit S [Vibrio casei]|uniref:restriction endonuclease subunit S n=1 Tax=Vibrio casei TaxID=673372 RepID=UPI003F9E5CF9